MDINLDLNGDLVFNADGDIAFVTGWEEAKQQILRLLFTNAKQVTRDGTVVLPEYVFAPNWGLSLTRLIGQPFGAGFKAAFTQKVRQAVAEVRYEDIDRTKEPLIEYFNHNVRIYVRIHIYLKQNRQVELAVFPVK